MAANGNGNQNPAGQPEENEEPQSQQSGASAAGEQPAAEGAAPAEGDALSQAEEILNSAGSEAKEDAGSAATLELRNDLLRLQAEYVNYRKRVERDRDVAREMAVIGMLNSLLPVLDDIEAARQHGDLVEGPFASIAVKLENTLKGYGMSRIDETGVDFDPNVHEALIQQQSPDVKSDTVTQILRTGYKANDRVLRAAQVIVSVPEQ